MLRKKVILIPCHTVIGECERLLLDSLFGLVSWARKGAAVVDDFWQYYIFTDGLGAHNIRKVAFLFRGR